MSGFIRALKTAAKLHPRTEAMTEQLAFLWQLAAHRRLIGPYLLPKRDPATVVKAPLLIGYFETGLGLGEYARGLAAALNAVGAPFSVYPYNSYTGRRRDEAPWTQFYDVNRVHSINIFCMAADQTRKARQIIGSRQTQGRYNILNTFWELPKAPQSWRSDLEFFDELWVPNRFVADSFRPIFFKDIFVAPPCINIGVDVVGDRTKFGLDPARFYFLFSFDLNSYPERKNPLAVIKSFQSAFGDSRDDVGLIVKTSGHRFRDVMSELEAAAKIDRRINIMHGDWKRADVLALLASVDCYVSLHRAEGFGYGMAEAMALGKAVIGTDFSGNTEFLTAQTGYPVPYRMRPVGQGEYPHYTGNSWAEPDIAVAAERMRAVASGTDDVRARARRGQAYIQRRYSPDTVGRQVWGRLQELMARVG